MNNFFRGREQDSCRVKTLLVKIIDIAVSSRKKRRTNGFTNTQGRLRTHFLPFRQSLTHKHIQVLITTFSQRRRGGFWEGWRGLSLSIFSIDIFGCRESMFLPQWDAKHQARLTESLMNSLLLSELKKEKLVFVIIFVYILKL